MKVNYNPINLRISPISAAEIGSNQPKFRFNSIQRDVTHTNVLNFHEHTMVVFELKKCIYRKIPYLKISAAFATHCWQ